MNELNVVFFASLKETLGIEQYVFAGHLPMTVKELKMQLAKLLKNGDALLDKGIQSSIDFEFARDGNIVNEGAKEVAFFPPVTGG
ncbi:molybdopterin synthase small subunit [Marinomonas spartinae]|uniref:Molybdopterin synthase small subunit n=1 Tax=Marinomonas spartinae TaxID=1792290 RepID=A0A1A8TS48_9GAMM|nr:MoaD/ThiS family protein [Marinomonas spartinae]SBS37449.1 molybdopterin synthase small subunit [Marinomonas spartinae]SBS37477.1 molybdopterin synthase small subunit [Marinomonas spartinae]